MPYISDGAEFVPVAIQFASETTGWLLYVAGQESGGGISMGFFLTDNGGDSWTRGTIPQQPICRSSNMIFVSDQKGWIGNNCPRVMSLVPRQDFLDGVFPPGLYETQDGGRSWNVNPVPMPQDFPDQATNPITNNPITNVEKFVFCGISNLEHLSGEAIAFI